MLWGMLSCSFVKLCGDSLVRYGDVSLRCGVLLCSTLCSGVSCMWGSVLLVWYCSVVLCCVSELQWSLMRWCL